MKHKSDSAVYIASFIAFAAWFAGPSWAGSDIAKKVIEKAEAAVEKVLSACDADLKAYCSKVTPGEGRLALCVMAHEDKISDQCFNAIFDVADGIDLAISNISRAADACDADMEKFCANVKEGEGRLAQCLIDHKSDISTNCRAEVAGFEARFQK